MARLRTIKPEFWSDERLGECSVSARLLFVGTLNFADDNGNLPRSAKQLKAQVFPYDVIDCEPLLQELLRHELLFEYEVSCVKFLHIKNFLKHQKIDHPSKTTIPLYEDSARTPRTVAPDSIGFDFKGVDSIEDQNPVPAKKIKRKKKDPESTDPRRVVFIADLKTHWDGLNPNGPAFAMDGADGKNIDLFLTKWAKLTQPEWRKALRHRRESANVIPAQAICKWVGNLLEYTSGTINEFHHLDNGGNGNGRAEQPSKAQLRNQRNREVAADILRKRYPHLGIPDDARGPDAAGSARGGNGRDVVQEPLILLPERN
jgi:hypothetical protein